MKSSNDLAFCHTVLPSALETNTPPKPVGLLIYNPIE
jgi:hypothetical protein